MDFSEICEKLAQLVYVVQNDVKMCDGVITITQDCVFEYSGPYEVPCADLTRSYLTEVLPQLLNISIEKHSINLFKKFKSNLYNIVHTLNELQNGRSNNSRTLKAYHQSCNFVQHILAPVGLTDNELTLQIYSLILNLPHLDADLQPRKYQTRSPPKSPRRMVPSETETAISEFASSPESWKHLISQSNMTEIPIDTIKTCSISKLPKGTGMMSYNGMNYVLELQIGDKLIRSNDTKIHHWIIGGKRVSERDFRFTLNGDYHPAYYRIFKSLIQFHLLTRARIDELIDNL